MNNVCWNKIILAFVTCFMLEFIFFNFFFTVFVDSFFFYKKSQAIPFKSQTHHLVFKIFLFRNVLSGFWQKIIT